MKHINDIENSMERIHLASREARREHGLAAQATEGMAVWHEAHLKRIATVRRYAAVACLFVLVLSTAIPLSRAMDSRHSAYGDANYEVASLQIYNMMGKV